MRTEEKIRELCKYHQMNCDWFEEALGQMAEWTEKHMLEKVCDYLCNNIDKDLVIYHDNTWLKRDEFVKRFKKAMEE